MGTMKIIGKAERKYTCDRMTISIHVIFSVRSIIGNRYGGERNGYCYLGS